MIFAPSTQMRAGARAKGKKSMNARVDKAHGVVVVHGEKLKLASKIGKYDTGRWYAYADKLKPDERYDIILENQNGEVVGVWFGYYVPSMFAVSAYPIWSAGGRSFGKTYVSERLVKLRKPYAES